MDTINMHMKFEIEIPKQTWLMLRKPCRLQTDGRTDGQGESSIPPSNFVGRGYKKSWDGDEVWMKQWASNNWNALSPDQEKPLIDKFSGWTGKSMAK